MKRMTLPVMANLVTLCFLVPFGEAFLLTHHSSITTEALRHQCVTVGKERLCFSSEAVTEINMQQGALDRGPAIGEFTEGYWHFDNETFEQANSNLIAYRQKIIERLTRQPLDPSDIHAARTFLARALHQVQDFYAHSNWVELNKTDVNRDLGVRSFTHPLASRTEATCNPADRLLPGLAKLTSGYYAGFKDCSVPQNKCRHGLSNVFQKCPGINKDDTDQTGFEKAKQFATVATKAFVEQLLNDSQLAGRTQAINRFLNDPMPPNP